MLFEFVRSEDLRGAVQPDEVLVHPGLNGGNDEALVVDEGLAVRRVEAGVRRAAVRPQSVHVEVTAVVVFEVLGSAVLGEADRARPLAREHVVGVVLAVREEAEPGGADGEESDQADEGESGHCFCLVKESGGALGMLEDSSVLGNFF